MDIKNNKDSDYLFFPLSSFFRRRRADRCDVVVRGSRWILVC
jgi:hypothetical protein